MKVRVNVERFVTVGHAGKVLSPGENTLEDQVWEQIKDDAVVVQMIAEKHLEVVDEGDEEEERNGLTIGGVYVPTLAEVLKAGYAQGAAEHIVADAQARADQALAAARAEAKRVEDEAAKQKAQDEADAQAAADKAKADADAAAAAEAKKKAITDAEAIIMDPAATAEAKEAAAAKVLELTK